MIYLHENGVTVVATDEAKSGKVYELKYSQFLCYSLTDHIVLSNHSFKIV
jgi:hypothetical protein